VWKSDFSKAVILSGMLSLLLFLMGRVGTVSAEPSLCSPYQHFVDKILKCSGKAGIQIVALPSGQLVYEYQPREPLVPASLVKLITSYSALKGLGPSSHFSTAVWSVHEPQGDTLSGNIWVKSEGDIFLLGENARAIVCRLTDMGVRRIRGDIVVDNSFFEPATEQICLDGKCGSSYNPVLSATALESNTITLRVSAAAKVGRPLTVTWLPAGDYVKLVNRSATGSKTSKTRLMVKSLGVTKDGREEIQVSGSLPLGTTGTHEYCFNVKDPAFFFARSFKALLQQAGIEIQGSAVGAGKVPSGTRKIVEYESPPLADLLYGLNRYSNNFMAEMLLRNLGGSVLGPPGTVDKGVSVVHKALSEIGIPLEEVSLDSGSGLSRECRVSTQAFCRILTSAYQDRSISSELLSSLAVNGQEGTLRKRMLGSGIEVRGKTGTLRDVVSFAGYVSEPGKGTFVVAILLNDVKNRWEAREALDSFLQELPSIAGYAGHDMRGAVLPSGPQSTSK
jgi:serine-type D-Ala-D-Ala carboxypeptidase/endopeptidase (penicillin-binding protein 4)